ncbi:hypothetical protein BaRGS_00000432 [Batillaria attramentaria]|uniref:Uncharacterized protein n=1 Tax=Batillaria attramentaria TaxID=370345 RepID=A0ABD0M8Q1_9CAEN
MMFLNRSHSQSSAGCSSFVPADENVQGFVSRRAVIQWPVSTGLSIRAAPRWLCWLAEEEKRKTQKPEIITEFLNSGLEFYGDAGCSLVVTGVVFTHGFPFEPLA